MRSDSDNGIYLRVKGFRATEGVHSDVVFLDLINRSLEVLFADVSHEPDEVIRPPENTRGQNVIYFTPLGLELTHRRLQVPIPLKAFPSTNHPPFGHKYSPMFVT